MGDNETYNLGSDDDDEIRNFYEFSGPDDDEYRYENEENDNECLCGGMCSPGFCSCSEECECRKSFCDCEDFQCPCAPKCDTAECTCDETCECRSELTDCCKLFESNRDEQKKESVRAELILAMEIFWEDGDGNQFRTNNWDDIYPERGWGEPSTILQCFGFDTYDFWVISSSNYTSIKQNHNEANEVSELGLDVAHIFGRVFEAKIIFPEVINVQEYGWVIPTASRRESVLALRVLRNLADKYSQACITRYLGNTMTIIPVLDPGIIGSRNFTIYRRTAKRSNRSDATRNFAYGRDFNENESPPF